jgi:hypothetical protein
MSKRRGKVVKGYIKVRRNKRGVYVGRNQGGKPEKIRVYRNARGWFVSGR